MIPCGEAGCRWVNRVNNHEILVVSGDPDPGAWHLRWPQIRLLSRRDRLCSVKRCLQFAHFEPHNPGAVNPLIQLNVKPIVAQKVQLNQLKLLWTLHQLNVWFHVVVPRGSLIERKQSHGNMGIARKGVLPSIDFSIGSVIPGIVWEVPFICGCLCPKFIKIREAKWIASGQPSNHHCQLIGYGVNGSYHLIRSICPESLGWDDTNSLSWYH